MRWPAQFAAILLEFDPDGEHNQHHSHEQSALPLACTKSQADSGQACIQAGRSVMIHCDMWCLLQEQLGVKVGKAAASKESESEEEDTEGDAAKEDESDKWSQEGRQQAVEALLGSCAGNDFAQESEILQVATPTGFAIVCACDL